MIYLQTATTGLMSISDKEARNALEERRREVALHGYEPSSQPEPELVYNFAISGDDEER